MKTGFNLLLWATHVTAEHFPLFDDLKRVGYDGVEIPMFEGDPGHYETVGRAVRDAGLECTSVAIIPDEEHSPISANPAHRQGAIDHISWAIECSQALNSKMFCGPYHQPLGVFSGDAPTEAERDRLVEVHQQVADRAAAIGLDMALEPLNRFECYILNTQADARTHAKRVDRPNFGVLYDTFHANIEEKDPIGCIATCANTIAHVHIAENDRGTPGHGHIDFANTMRALRGAGYDGWLVIEAFSRALPALAAATRVWRDFFETKEEVYTDGLATMQTTWRGGA